MGACFTSLINQMVIWEYDCLGLELLEADLVLPPEQNFGRRLWFMAASIIPPIVGGVILFALDSHTILSHKLVISSMILPIGISLFMGFALYSIRASLLVKKTSLILTQIAFVKSTLLGTLVQASDPNPIAGFVETCCYIIWAFFIEFGSGIPTPIAAMATCGTIASTFVWTWVTKNPNHKENGIWATIIIPIGLTVAGYYLIAKYSESFFPTATILHTPIDSESDEANSFFSFIEIEDQNLNQDQVEIEAAAGGGVVDGAGDTEEEEEEEEEFESAAGDFEIEIVSVAGDEAVGVAGAPELEAGGAVAGAEGGLKRVLYVGTVVTLVTLISIFGPWPIAV